MGHRVKDSGRKLKETGFSYKDQGAMHKTIFHMIPEALHLKIFEQPHGGFFQQPVNTGNYQMKPEGDKTMHLFHAMTARSRRNIVWRW